MSSKRAKMSVFILWWFFLALISHKCKALPSINFKQVMDNSTQSWPIYLSGAIVAPEFINLFLLGSAVYVMYNGIEILHPIYSVLFLNTSIALLHSVFDIVIFCLIDNDLYVRIANGGIICYVIFHCVVWCVTSILRYIYILHNDWIDLKFPGVKRIKLFFTGALI